MKEAAYFIFTPSICKIGGAERYVSNKVSFLKKKGIDVFVFSFVRGDIVLENLKQFKKITFSCLRLNPALYRASFVKGRIKKLINYTSAFEYQTIFVESTEINCSLWAEAFSKVLNAKHIFFDLQENHYYSHEIKKYLHFKYNRNELFGINDLSIRSIFDNEYSQDMENRFISAVINLNVVDDIPYNLPDYNGKYDYTIGSIGRLDKPHVLPMLINFCGFAKRHEDKRFLLILIGDGTKKVKKTIVKLFKNNKNIHLFITGFLSPISCELLDCVDCFFSSAGSARVSFEYGKPTISISVENGNAIGILGYTTSNTLYEDKSSGPMFDLTYYLEEILFKSFCELHSKNDMPIWDKTKSFDELESQYCLFTNNSKVEYFDPLLLHENGLKWKLYIAFSHLLGGTLFERLQYVLNKVKVLRR